MSEATLNLEQAILERARRLATEYQIRAQRSRDNILRDAKQHLHLREEREVLLAKAKAERLYRRKVQASELRLQKEMDLLRWNLVSSVRAQLMLRLQALSDDTQTWLPILKRLLERSIAQLPPGRYQLLLNERDRERAAEHWAEWSQGLPDGIELQLSSRTRPMTGGIYLERDDGKLRLDNSFEARLERQADALNQRILQRLLPARAIPDLPAGANR